MYYITRDELMGLAERYPETHKRIRRFGVYMAIRRDIVLRAKVKLLEANVHKDREGAPPLLAKKSSLSGMGVGGVAEKHQLSEAELEEQ